MAVTGQPAASKLPTTILINQAGATTVQSAGFSYTSGIVQQVVPAIVQ